MRFLSFGEILFDILPTGSVLGGAPINVATHLARLGSDSYVVSAIGADELGSRAIEKLNKEGVKTKFVSLSGFDTGRADIVLDNSGSASYKFNFPAAWDEIRLFPQEKTRIYESEWDGFVFGTLSQRSDISKETLVDLLENIKVKEIVFDINLRGEFYSKDELELGLRYATILKLNQEELEILLSLLSFESIYELFEKHHSLKGILLTKGEDGLEYITKDNVVNAKAIQSSVVDTVGAGDSVTAAFLFFYSKTHDVEYALEKASILASFVVSTKGALSEYSSELKSKLI